jgi:hypothetical protein
MLSAASKLGFRCVDCCCPAFSHTLSPLPPPPSQSTTTQESVYNNNKHLVARLHFPDTFRQKFPSTKFLSALARLSRAHAALEEQPDWLQPKGVGVVCVKRDGIKKNSFVHFYLGKMCDIIHISFAFRFSHNPLPQLHAVKMVRARGCNPSRQGNPYI